MAKRYPRSHAASEWLPLKTIWRFYLWSEIIPLSRMISLFFGDSNDCKNAWPISLLAPLARSAAA